MKAQRLGFVFLFLLPIVGGAGAGSCQQTAAKTALDVVACAGNAVADNAAPLLGDVAAIVFSNNTDAQASDALAELAVKNGIAAVGCAIEVIIRDLGGAGSQHRTAAMHASPSVVSVALGRAQAGRLAVAALASQK